MNTIMFPRILNAYWLLIVGGALSSFAMGRWLMDRNYHPIELFYWIAFFVCAFNFVACYKNVRSQIVVGRIGILALMLWPILLMYGNLEPAKPTMASQVSWVSFLILGTLAIPVAQLGELAVHFIVVSLGFSSTHDLSVVMSLTQYFIFETARYVIWISIQWFWFVPFIMRLVRRKIGRSPAVAETKTASAAN